MLTSKQPQRVVIAGGGTAGWIAAALLSKAWQDTAITVIESPQIGRIGVGESSIPPLRRLLTALGIDEADWMRACHATFKTSLHFVGWHDSAPRHEYYHPLFCWGETNNSLFSNWLAATRSEAYREPFDATHFLGVHLTRARKAPKPIAAAASSPLQYAYHLDAVLFADYLKAWATQRGVTGIVDHISAVCLGPDGNIDHLQTVASGDLSADWFFDCTGFKGLLINQALNEPFVSYADTLFCDSAIALSTFPKQPPKTLSCETKATALSAGWCWDIPLRQRNGAGYVYASSQLGPDQAEAELRAHLGTEVEQGEARRIDMRVGVNRRVWVKNCISLGLAAGFIEPLESTAIFCSQFGVAQLLQCLRERDTLTAQQALYNERMHKLFEGIRDFVLLHYHLSRRDGFEFWRANRHHTNLPSSLRALIAAWRQGADLSAKLAGHGSAYLSEPTSWHCIFAGLHSLPDPNPRQPATGAQRPRLHAQLRQLRRRAQAFPDQYAYLTAQDG